MELRKRYVRNIPFLRDMDNKVVSEVLFLMKEEELENGTLLLSRD